MKMTNLPAGRRVRRLLVGTMDMRIKPRKLEAGAKSMTKQDRRIPRGLNGSTSPCPERRCRYGHSDPSALDHTFEHLKKFRERDLRGIGSVDQRFSISAQRCNRECHGDAVIVLRIY